MRISACSSIVALSLLAVLATGCASVPEVREGQDPTQRFDSYEPAGYLDDLTLTRTVRPVVRVRVATREQTDRRRSSGHDARDDVADVGQADETPDAYAAARASRPASFGTQAHERAGMGTMGALEETLAADLADVMSRPSSLQAEGEGRPGGNALEYLDLTADAALR